MNKFLKIRLRNNSNFAGLLVLAFLIFGFIGILNHEMWGDELQAWLIARDSSSIVDLFRNLKYEGHPGLWHLSLHVLSKFTHNPVVMQIFHLLLAAGGIYIFSRFSPFTNLQKILFTFGYFPFYEYAVISRSYVLGVILIFSFCIFFETRTKSYILLAFILFLLANTSVYGLIIAISLSLTLLFEFIFNKRLLQCLSLKKVDLIISLLIFSAGVVSSIIQITPPLNSSFGVSGLAEDWITEFDTERFIDTALTIWRSYIPIPNFSYSFWNTNILLQDNSALNVIGVILSLGLFILSLKLFIQKPVVFFLYTSGTLSLLLFTYAKFLGWSRHHGHLFILLIACLWISAYYPESKLSDKFEKGYSLRLYVFFSTQLLKKYSNAFVTILLCVHVIAGSFAFTMDLFQPFCKSKEVVEFIQRKHMEDMLIVGSRDYVSASISGYLDKKIYYPDINRFGSFMVWNDEMRIVGFQELLEKISRLTAQVNTDILLVVSYELNNRRPDISISPLAKFTNTRTIYVDQDYYLYLIRHKNS